MATKATAAAVSRVMVFHAPEAKHLVKDNHECIRPEGLGVFVFQAGYSQLLY